MTLTIGAGDDDASFMPGGKAMANDAEAMLESAGSGWKICVWAVFALLLTFLCLACYLRFAAHPGPLPTAAAPAWPSVSC